MSKYLHIGIVLSLLWWAQSAFAQDTIPLNTTHSFKASYQPDYSYSWWYTNSAGDTTYFSSNSNETEEVLWDTEGDYKLFAQANSGSNCLSEIISKTFVVKNKPDAGLIISAGRDTTIGSCNPYQLSATVEHQPGFTYSYLWRPSGNLDNLTKADPIFTPVNTTTFVLTVTNNLGVSSTDSVLIAVSDVIASAGNDIYMEQNSTTILDGTASSGEGLNYNWTTVSGKIESGANTASPIVSGFGDYLLEVTDMFGCIGIDSVKVIRITHAPVAVDDYDTTSYQREVKISVLDNDTDKDNSIVPSTLSIKQLPMSGTTYVDYDDFTIHYRPNIGFSGNDNFEYQICNTYNKCDQAYVYVMVTDFKFLIPNAFSPNGDGINDYFEILGIEFYEGNTISIINRWGNKVFEAKNYGISSMPKLWDGKANAGTRIGNDELPTGTYYYILDLGNGEDPIGGSIYLDR